MKRIKEEKRKEEGGRKGRAGKRGGEGHGRRGEGRGGSPRNLPRPSHSGHFLWRSNWVCTQDAHCRGWLGPGWQVAEVLAHSRPGFAPGLTLQGHCGHRVARTWDPRGALECVQPLMVYLGPGTVHVTCAVKAIFPKA